MFDLKNLTISSTSPCLIIYLLDQSGSMDDKFGNGSHSKAAELALAMNEVIYEVGLRCIGSGGDIKNRFELAIIGYGKEGDKVQSGWEGQLTGKWIVSIRDIFDYPFGQVNNKPIWINPYGNGSTPMTKAFENAKRLCHDWINWGNHAESHPPIIINITDGEVTDGGRDYSLLKSEIEEINRLKTNFGSVNILNIHISTMSKDRVLFPSSISEKSDVNTKLLFDISTPLNDNMLRIAQQKGYDIQIGAKGYVFNGNASDLINFLNIGTPQ